ncbi:MAG: glycosyltransferase family 4 protein, partial [Methylophaga sp.]|nr:glycosyltransferase family 4 protein [Methylophaga sp.]
DISEYRQTKFLFAGNKFNLILATMRMLGQQPKRFFSTFYHACRLSQNSERGLLRHFAYFVEACQLAIWCREDEIDHIHAHFGTNSTMVVMLAFWLGGPTYSFTVHGPEEFDKPQFIALAEKIAHSAFVVAISHYGRAQLSRWIDVSLWSKVKVIHCGLEAAAFEQHSDLPNPVDGQIVCVGRLCEQKGQQLLIEAIAQLRDQGLSVKLILAGDGPMRADLEAAIKQYDLQSLVSITGWIDNPRVQILLRQSQAMVLPSFAEGLPVVIMEAMAAGCPVISTYIAGIPELIKHGDNGFLVPAGNVMALTEAIQYCLAMPKAERLPLIASAREAVTAQHNIEAEVSKLAGCFEHAVQQHKPQVAI